MFAIILYVVGALAIVVGAFTYEYRYGENDLTGDDIFNLILITIFWPLILIVLVIGGTVETAGTAFLNWFNSNKLK